MLVADDISEHPLRHHDSGDDTRVVVLVNHNVLPTLHERRDDSLSRLVSGAEEEAGLSSHEFCEPGFEFVMQIERSGQIPRSGTTRAVFLDGFDGGFFDFRMSGEAEVI